MFQEILTIRAKLLIFILIINSTLSAQTPTQTVRGRVIDGSNNKALIGAAIQLLNTPYAYATDGGGVFQFKDLPVGKYTLKASFIGYETFIISDFWVQSGKEIVLDIQLYPSEASIDTLNIVITTDRPNTDAIVLLTDPFSRYAATFNDPARALTYLPGATTDNDQGNNISVRGNTPNALQWYLEGAEIVNPNHLSNAGTPSDRTTANGGGVLIAGINMMESATLHKGAMEADLGGSLTSIMDLRFRKGNDKKKQTFVSVGLIGVEAGTEGAFKRPDSAQTSSPNAASYLVHYRYSTIGLLSKMGVPLGDEAITFQDVSYNFNFPTKKIGTFNIFGMHGWSDNVFKNKPREEWTTEKDSQDITYKNQMHVVGLKYKVGVGRRGLWQTVAAYSWLFNDRDAIGYSQAQLPLLIERAGNNHSKLFIKTKISWQSQLGLLRVGSAFKDEQIEMPYQLRAANTETKTETNGQDYWFQPFIEWEGYTGRKLQYCLGLRGSVLTKAEQFAVEPTLGLQYSFDNNSALSLNLSAQSQVLSPWVYLMTESLFSGRATKDFHLTQSHNANINYRFFFNNAIDINVGAFYQSLFNIPQTLAGGIGTALDELDIAGTRIWSNKDFAKGRNAGAEVDINQTRRNGFHWRVNLTLYDAKIIDPEGKERDARFNGQYIFNTLVGKEWAFGTHKNKFWGINGHVLLRGGFRETPINLAASIAANRTVYDNLNPFVLQLKDYFRTDMSIYLKRNRLKWSSTLQLDIQNLTNYQNEAWRYFDRFQKRVVTKFQLGIIPNLTYRVEF